MLRMWRAKERMPNKLKYYIADPEPRFFRIVFCGICVCMYVCMYVCFKRWAETFFFAFFNTSLLN